ncbi:long-chain fatty acid--CoA ligase [Arhodomonas aquaeolei]|uniref:long-chain fatty acid--CoA ligase n=1 Tax=Arhodomonas aquaeolei TaxID=2369 RepID=UPI00216932C8|nr:long-chain fatty acid--CoA ligase [Arhodomonas aquaeolei]MCS4504142.1 long-chain fatty acid--CoA ligase [Arhodomonas aquaeolei]
MAERAMELPDIRHHDTFPKLVAYNAAHWGDEVAMREKEFGIWNEYTWRDYDTAVRRFALGMHALGLERGETVCIIGGNRPEWVHCEVGAHAIGAMSLGMYQDSLNDEVAYLINYAEAPLVMCEDEEQVDKALEITEQCPCVRHIVYHDPRGMRKYDDPRLISQDELFERAEALERERPGLYKEMLAAGRGEDVAMLITTSGTTSKPKLSMMQAGPFLDHCLAYLRADPKFPDDNYVSVLPLPWIMEQVYAVAQSLLSRITVNFVEATETMMADLREIGPNFVLLAPRVWETIAADVKARMMEASPFKRRMYDAGMRLGMEAVERGEHSRLAHWILFRALKDRLGFTYLRSAATGGAALGPDTFKFFLAMGVPLRQLYGQTELAGAYTIHRGDDIDYDTVGVPFDNADVRIDNADENGVGEIVARNSGMFLGYYKNEKATAEDIEDGWMYTGDAGYFKKSNGHLVVIDRVKDLATTSRGDRYSPMFIENKLKFSPFIAEAVILGHERPYLAAMICIRYGIMAKWAEQRGVAFTNYTNLSAQPEVYDLIRSEVEQVNATLPEWQRIRKFLLLYKELDPDDGELTRTRKVRRGVIQEKYSDIIEAVYGGDDQVHVDTVITFQDGTTSRIRTDLRLVDLAPDDGVPSAAGENRAAGAA